MMRSLNLIDKAFFLKKTTLFAALELDLLLSIADKMEHLIFKSGEEIFHYSQDAHRLYFIIGGTVVIKDEAQQELAHLNPGDFFGDEALFNQKPRLYTAVSLQKCETLAILRSHFLAIIQECPSVALILLEFYAAQMAFRTR